MPLQRARVTEGLEHLMGTRPSPAAASSRLPSSCCPGARSRGRGLQEGGTPTSRATSNQGDLPPALFPLARREAKDGGLTVVVDARKQPPAPVLFSALRSVQVRRALRASAMEVLGGESLPGSERCHVLGVLQSLPCTHRTVQSPG